MVYVTDITTNRRLARRILDRNKNKQKFFKLIDNKTKHSLKNQIKIQKFGDLNNSLAQNVIPDGFNKALVYNNSDMALLQYSQLFGGIDRTTFNSNLFLFQVGFNWLNAKFNEINNSINAINNRINTINNHFNGLFRTAYLLLATILNQQRRMDQRMNDLEARVRNLEHGRDAAGEAGVQVAENLEAQVRNVAANAARVQAGGVVENVEVEERQRASTEPCVDVEQME